MIDRPTMTIDQHNERRRAMLAEMDATLERFMPLALDCARQRGQHPIEAAALIDLLMVVQMAWCNAVKTVYPAADT